MTLECSAMDELTQRLANFGTACRTSRISAHGAQAAIEHLVDTVACAIAGRDCRGAQIGRRLAGPPGSGEAGLVLFGEQGCAPDMAAFTNTCMIRALDFNDRYPGGHPSDCLGAHFAAAGLTKLTGSQFIAGLLATYEVFARLCDGAMLSRKGWDQGFAVGVSTVVGLGCTLGLTEREIANAIGIIASSSVPLRVTRSGELTEWKNVATAYAVRNAFFACELAREGLQAPQCPFSGRNGLWENITGPFQLAPFHTEGGTFQTPRVQLKFWPVETNAQPVVWAALELRDRVSTDELIALDVFTNKFTWFEIGSEPEKWDPQTPETADHSLPYIFATTLRDGSLDHRAFTVTAAKDRTLRPLMQKIAVHVDPEIDRLPAGQVKLVAVAKRTNGTSETITVTNPLGHPDNPMGREDVEEKFIRLARPMLGIEASRALLARLWKTSTEPDMAQLLAHFHV